MENLNKDLSELTAKAKKSKNLEPLKELEQNLHIIKIGNFQGSRLGEPYSFDNLIKNCPEMRSVQELKQSIEKKDDFLKVLPKYKRACIDVAKKYNTMHSPAQGLDRQKTVDLYIKMKRLPEGVNPHTYDLSKEGNLGVMYHFGGHTEVMLEKGKHNSYKTEYFLQGTDDKFSTAPLPGVKSKKLNGHTEYFKDPLSGTNVVFLEFEGLSNKSHRIIAAPNTDGKLTPLQKDLIEVGARMGEEEVKAFNILTNRQEYMDYDAILSLIQHYAHDPKFMARPVA